MRVHIAQSIANEGVRVEGLFKRTTNEIKGVSEHVSRLEGNLWRINERIEEVAAVKRQIELEFEKLIKNKIPELVGELLDTPVRKFNAEFKRVAEKELNLRLHVDKVHRDL